MATEAEKRSFSHLDPPAPPQAPDITTTQGMNRMLASYCSNSNIENEKQRLRFEIDRIIKHHQQAAERECRPLAAELTRLARYDDRAVWDATQGSHEP